VNFMQLDRTSIRSNQQKIKSKIDQTM